MPTLPSAPANVEIFCDVSRKYGRVSGCKADEGVVDALAKPAERQGNTLSLEPSALDPDSDIPLRLRLALLIDPADAKFAVVPVGVVPLKANEVAWLQQPTGAEIARLYPERALRMGLAARITVLFQIGADGGLTCMDEAVVSASGEEGNFDGWCEKVVSLYRAPAVLADSQPSAGRWVSMSYNLRPN
jgi:hypothetical protein